MALPMASFASSRESRIALALAALAALRVFLGASSFPFFTNVDEHRHVDVVLKYARGYAPRPGTDAYEPQMPTLLGLYGSPEYHVRPDVLRERGVPPPPWRRPPAETIGLIEYNERFLANRPNLEAYQPPAYYATAGAWLALGRAIGLDGGVALYWVRQLGALLAFALVWLTWRGLRDVYPDDALLRLGAPALVAVFPLDTVYYVTPDSMSPLLAGAAVLLALRVARAPASTGIHAAAGLVAASAVLCKYTNAAIVPVLAVASGAALARRSGDVGRLLLLWGLFLAPVAAWLVRNQLLFDDPLGTALKVERLGWERKAPGEWLDHPLFTVSGLAWFVKELVPMFWRGEIVWARSILRVPAVDVFYLATTLLCVPLAAVGLVGRARVPRLGDGLSLLAVVGFAGVLAALSLLFVFTETSNPNTDRPFFFHGRLVSGAIVPFAIVIVRGLEVGAARLGAGARGGRVALGVVLVAVAISELFLSAGPFGSAYNWFGLP